MEIRTQEQFDLADYMRSHHLEQQLFWVGGYQLPDEGEWVWASDDSPIDMERFWAASEANNGNGLGITSSQDCLFFFARPDLRDGDCNNTLEFLCSFN